MPTRCLLVLLDGIGDRSQPELDDRTPLQAAHTPMLDRLAAAGACGTYHAGAQGQCLPSEMAHFSLFGYDTDRFPGRGLLEALGAGVEVEPGEVAVLARLATVREDHSRLILDQPKPSLTAGEAEALLEAVARFDAENVRFRLRPLQGGAAILILTGDVSSRVTDTNIMSGGQPLPAIRPWAEAAREPSAQRTARVLTAYHRWAYQELCRHSINQDRHRRGLEPANGIITQRAGRHRAVEPFGERTGLRGVSVAAGEVYGGLARYLGMETVSCLDGPDPGADFANRLARATECLEAYSFVHVHSKAPDEAAHRKDPRGKCEVIGELDRALGRFIDRWLADPELLVVVTGDHSTPSGGPLIHSGETVPLLMCGRGVRRDEVVRFDEIRCAGGALGAVRGKELMLLVLNGLDRSKLLGVRDVPEDRWFWPGCYEPFRLD